MGLRSEELFPAAELGQTFPLCIVNLAEKYSQNNPLCQHAIVPLVSPRAYLMMRSLSRVPWRHLASGRNHALVELLEEPATSQRA